MLGAYSEISLNRFATMIDKYGGSFALGKNKAYATIVVRIGRDDLTSGRNVKSPSRNRSNTVFFKLSRKLPGLQLKVSRYYPPSLSGRSPD
jgi:hypothetical protein